MDFSAQQTENYVNHPGILFLFVLFTIPFKKLRVEMKQEGFEVQCRTDKHVILSGSFWEEIREEKSSAEQADKHVMFPEILFVILGKKLREEIKLEKL